MDIETFQSELLANESLLWTGQPERRVIFHKEDIVAIPFSLVWGGFAIFWESAALGFGKFQSHDGAPWFFVLWGVPFVLIGQYMIWGRFIYVAWKKSRTFYAITNKRILLRTVGKWFNSSFTSLDLPALAEIQKSVRSDGIGTLQFGHPAVLPGQRRNSTSLDPLDRNGVPAFVDILDAENVYRTIMETKEKLNTNQASAFGFSSGN